MVDAVDSKSAVLTGVPVQVRPGAPFLNYAPVAQLDRAFDYGSKG